jgi:DNA-binding response OmpR family regulator
MADLLVVEDDEDISTLVEILFTERGHVVRIASNGEEGLQRLSERLPDLVVMDVEMPLVSGPTMAARMFVENLGRENLPIVIVSGSDELRATAREVGTPYYLPKPFAPRKLVELVDRALRERTLPRPPTDPDLRRHA